MTKELHALVVDDEWSIRSFTKDVLEDLGFIVTEAGHPQDAAARLKERGYHILVTDNSMPSGKGTDFLREITGQYPDMARLLVSAESDALSTAAQMGIPSLEKPYNASQLITAVEQAMSPLPK